MQAGLCQAYFNQNPFCRPPLCLVRGLSPSVHSLQTQVCTQAAPTCPELRHGSVVLRTTKQPHVRVGQLLGDLQRLVVGANEGACRLAGSRQLRPLYACALSHMHLACHSKLRLPGTEATAGMMEQSNNRFPSTSRPHTSPDVLIRQRLAKALWRRRHCAPQQQRELVEERFPEDAPLLLQCRDKPFP